jgi:diguanylate cyclase (GGDEF)-like protein
VSLIDLDGLKILNDRLGEAVGDDALIWWAEQLHPVGRATDTVARIGGDKFLVVCPDIASASDAIVVATRITASQPRFAWAAPPPASGLLEVG